VSDYQLRACNSDGEGHGPWYDLEGREQFHSSAGFCLVRRKPAPRGQGWYQLRHARRAEIAFWTHDPGDDYDKMHVEVLVEAQY
jgi:hypothetical protein